MAAKNTEKKAVKAEVVKAEAKPVLTPNGAPMREGSKLTYQPVKKFRGLDGDSTYASKSADGTARICWNGHNITAILRYMGYEGANVKQALAWCLALGYTVHPTTVSCQVTSGRAGKAGWKDEKGKKCAGGWRGELPEFTADEKKYITSIRPVADAE